jgi:LuxR family maltose regulon positive regulatory protein
MEQTNSQQMLEHLEQSNLFVVSLDSRRQWYRYHALFAEALHYQLGQTHADLVPKLHTRASRWYAQHQQTTLAILHALRAKEWHWAADLIEQAYLPLLSFAWGLGKCVSVQVQQLLEQLPADILACRPRLCMICAHMLWMVAPYPLLYTWLDIAEGALRMVLERPTSAEVSQAHLTPQARREQENLLGEILTVRVILWSHGMTDGQTILALCEQAEGLLTAQNAAFRVVVAIAKLLTYYTSSLNEIGVAIECGLDAIRLSQATGQCALAVMMMTFTATFLITAGRLHEAERLTQQILLLGTRSDSSMVPEVGFPIALRADILREWNELDEARSLASEAISLCEQAISIPALPLLYRGYVVLMRICLSRGDLDAAGTFLQQAEQVGRSLNQPLYLHLQSLFTTVDQVRLWLACGELDRATRWAEQLEIMPQSLTPFACERQEVARACVLLAQDQPAATLQRLEPALQRATAGQRWGHVIEIRLLQVLAHQRLDEEPQALAALSEAVRLGEPEGYIRSFVDEGAPVADLLRKLRQEQRQTGPTTYLDMLLAAFAKESQRPKRFPKQSRSRRFP